MASEEQYLDDLLKSMMDTGFHGRCNAGYE